LQALIATVKMSQLPDKGERLMSYIDNLTTDLGNMEQKIKSNVKQMNALLLQENAAATGKATGIRTVLDYV